MMHLASENKKYEIKFGQKNEKKITEWAKQCWEVYVKTGEGGGKGGQSKGMHS